MSFSRRVEYLLRARSYLLENIDNIAEAITVDNGKPLTESLTAEVYPVADLIYYFAHNTEKLLKSKRIPISIWQLLGRSSRLGYQPLGTVGIISPWNFPFSIPVGTVVMALMAGNCVMLKPSSSAAYVGQQIEKLFNAAGLPEGVFTHVPGNAQTGQALLQAPLNKIFFTGSSNVGHEVMNVCSRRLTPCNLELGGKDPMIVLPDADIKHAASAAVWGAFTNAGQCCASIERVYVHKDVADKFTEMVVEETSKLRIGPGLDPVTDVGPLTTKAQFETVEDQVKDARNKGAQILTGGERVAGLKGYFYKPTVITEVDHSFQCVHDETFGPLMPIMTFEDERQAIHLANDTPYGLNGYVWTRSIKKGKEIAKQLRCGTVAINECVYTHALPQTPWGGVAASGFGRTHGASGLKEMVNLHHIHINRCTYFKDVWWYPYNSKLYTAFKKLSALMTGGLISKIRAMPTFIKLMLKRR
jgi:succinate-semialdehyde dehydrogenase/glutarate-semialdehyde dehydrogenase